MKNIAIIIAILIAAAAVYKLSQNGDEQRPQPANINKYADQTKSLISKTPKGARIFLLEPGDGSIVSSPVTVKFGVANITIAPAGEDQPDSGHHHLLIDMQELPDMTQPLPASDNLVHFGKGQTETTIELAPGRHTLQLLIGNYLHIPHDQPILSKKISITVE